MSSGNRSKSKKRKQRAKRTKRFHELHDERPSINTLDMMKEVQAEVKAELEAKVEAERLIKNQIRNNGRAKHVPLDLKALINQLRDLEGASSRLDEST